MFSCFYSVQTSLRFLSTVPEIPPSEVSGGGGSRSELVITWDVSLLASSFLHRTSFCLFFLLSLNFPGFSSGMSLGSVPCVV